MKNKKHQHEFSNKINKNLVISGIIGGGTATCGVIKLAFDFDNTISLIKNIWNFLCNNFLISGAIIFIIVFAVYKIIIKIINHKSEKNILNKANVFVNNENVETINIDKKGDNLKVSINLKNKGNKSINNIRVLSPKTNNNNKTNIEQNYRA